MSDRFPSSPSPAPDDNSSAEPVHRNKHRLVIGFWIDAKNALFHGHGLYALLALGLLILGCSLGFWQLDRAAQKQARIDAFDKRSQQPIVALDDHLDSNIAADLDIDRWRYRKVEVEGEPVVERQYLLDNRTRHGVAGYHVHLPFRLHDSDRMILVNRGWVAVGSSRQSLPDTTSSASMTRVSGILDLPRHPPLLGDDGYASNSWPKVVQRIDIESIGRDLGQPLLPLVLQMDPEQPGGFARQWEAHLGIGPDRHRGYALQWFSLGIVAFIAILVIAHANRTDPSN
ncbi:SURF1 family protein [Thioalkalivibrio sp. HK1]|uniref:SURF1 family protein n=1 Tax=Thioalkalivibrio sp. HK1 TaxID=1469245 RepID=UPI00046E8168|nr:SURF1 family protein [Thioalkalivibrio sp. HK1]